jgi:hypothetical protein
VNRDISFDDSFAQAFNFCGFANAEIKRRRKSVGLFLRRLAGIDHLPDLCRDKHRIDVPLRAIGEVFIKAGNCTTVAARYIASNWSTGCI